MHERGSSTFSLLFLLFLLFLTLEIVIVLGNDEFLNAIKAAEDEETKHNANCASTRRVKRHDHARFPSSPPTGTSFGKALRFFGHEVIRFTGALQIPSHHFTVDLWIKPEGGQKSSVTVMGLFDDCSPESRDGGWAVGLQEARTEQSLRVFFRLRTQRSNTNTTLLSPRSVEPNVWLHVAATYNGKNMKLYINQAEVAVSSEQKGHVFAHGLHCEHLEAGGNRSSGVFFRGTMDEVRVWSIAKSHKDISTNVFARHKEAQPSLELDESFAGKEELNRNPKTTWVVVTKSEPEIIESTIPGDAHDLSISKPPCGNTVCDNPEIVKSYVKNTHLRSAKVVRYRVINIRDDDGTNPMVTKEEIKLQHALLNKAFKPYNITFELAELTLRNTSLRRRSVMYLCDPEKIGDGVCHNSCKSAVTGIDGGDCDKYHHREPCSKEEHQGNGKCDAKCNRYYNGWDFGDCCNKSITNVYKTCFDPNSPNRAYMSHREYTSMVNVDNKRFLNVFLAQWSAKHLQGVATFPWEKSVHSIHGGIIMRVENFGQKEHLNALIHEVGHILGLWHVHHGVTELDCTDECAETFPSLELGDLCSDTNPTPANGLCKDPVSSDTCGLTFLNTPYNNYMSYASDSCTDSFTEQQAARMHCYLDLIYQSWQSEDTPPSFIPLPPRVTSVTEASVQLTWIPPLGTGGENARRGCQECRENRVFQQYAVTAESPKPAKPNGFWAPHQAIGAPDSEPCILTPKAWTPLNLDDCKDCHIELGFKEAVIPTRLSVWVTRASRTGINDIQLIFTDGSRLSLGNATAQCDAPLTISLKVKRKAAKVAIYVNNPTTAIDAVRLTSTFNHPNCLKCEPLEYRITRKPPFPSGKSERVKATRFIDRYLLPSSEFTYTVQAVTSSGLVGPPSPPLVYSPDRGFCGDGKVEKEIGEECDDGNVRDGDGCNVQCKKEDVFQCTGHPSLCYRHEGDGKCEEFERKNNIQDCGFYTPDGFDDQWAISATVKSEKQDKYRLEHIIPGPAPRDLDCLPTTDSKYKWSDCNTFFSGCDFSFEVLFNHSVVPAAVVLYIASDGQSRSSAVETVKVELIDNSGRVHLAGRNQTTISCKANPAVVPIFHDMMQPFFYVRKARISFKSSKIAIAGVGLRSKAQFDVMEGSRCEADEVFSPRTKQCHRYMCERPSCDELNVKYASVKCEGIEEGQICSVTCSEGYRPMKPFKLMCLSKQWHGVHKSCVPVSCGVPRVPNGKADCPEGYTFGKKCSLKCVPQAKMSGEEGSIVCEEDGRWSAQTAFCVMTCTHPTIPQNSVALRESNCMESKRTFLPGMSCKYRCKAGFKVKDREEALRRTHKLRCTKSGRWSGSNCEPIVCKEIPPNMKMWYNCTDGVNLGSVCLNQCPGDEVREIKCDENGEWNHPFKRCTSPSAGTCRRPTEPPGVVIECEDHYVGGLCKLKCKDLRQDVVIKGDEEKWSVTLTCTSKLEWDPDPALLRCIPSCKENFIGDNYCDSYNNNKHCHWDGGDCCASTSGLRIVRSPTKCREACACKDPDAVENRRPGNNSDDDEDEDDEGDIEGSGASEDQFKTSSI